MARKQTSMKDEQSGGEQHEPVTTPSSSLAVTAASKHDSDSDSVPETETQMIASVSKAKKKKKRSKKKKKKRSKKKKEAESLSVVAVAFPRTTEKKRPIGEGSVSEADPKRHKTEEKRQPFQRIWSEQDEIVLLQSVIDFGMDPYKDKIGFHELVRPSISIEVSNSQLLEKIRNLRNKFYNKEKKGLEKIIKDHDRTCFEISEQIWGVNGIAVKSVKKVKKEEDREKVVPISGEDDWFEKSFLLGSVPSFGLGEQYVKRGWSLVPMERKAEIQQKLKLLEEKARKLAVVKMDLVRDAASAIV